MASRLLCTTGVRHCCGLSLLLGVGLTACTGGAPLECGPGTHQSGATCIADTSHGSDAGPASDAGTSPPPSPPPASDAGSGFSLTPPGVDAGPGGGSSGIPPGCDAASGECDAWTAELMTLVDGARAGCGGPVTVDSRIAGVAARHAAYQASIDRIDSTSPDGPLFDQVAAAGVHFGEASVLFASTRDGPSDVMTRWGARADSAGYLAHCWGAAGASFATSASGQSFVTLLFVQPVP